MARRVFGENVSPKPTMRLAIFAAIFLCRIFASASEERWEPIRFTNADFDYGAGLLTFPAPAGESLATALAIDREIGDSTWHVRADLVAGTSRRAAPEIEINYHHRRSAIVRWNPTLPAAQRAPAFLWKVIPGIQLQSQRTYLLSVEVDTGARLTAEDWRRRGFGLALHTGATAGDHGQRFIDSFRDDIETKVENLHGTAQRLTISFRTSFRPPAGDLGVVIQLTSPPSRESALAGDHYLLRHVSLMISAAKDQRTDQLADEAPTPKLIAPATDSQYFPDHQLVPVGRSPASPFVPAVPEPGVAALLLTALPLFLRRARPSSGPAAKKSIGQI